MREVCAGVLKRTDMIHRENAPAGQPSPLKIMRPEPARATLLQPRFLLLDEISGGQLARYPEPRIDLLRANTRTVNTVCAEPVGV